LHDARRNRGQALSSYIRRAIRVSAFLIGHALITIVWIGTIYVVRIAIKLLDHETLFGLISFESVFDAMEVGVLGMFILLTRGDSPTRDGDVPESDGRPFQCPAARCHPY
jgi:hypothetical protein